MQENQPERESRYEPLHDYQPFQSPPSHRPSNEYQEPAPNQWVEPVQPVPVYPVMINFVTRFWGGVKFIGTGNVTFYPQGFHIMGRAFWDWWKRLLVGLPLLLLGIIPALLIVHFACRENAEDFVPYGNIIKARRKRRRMNILARNSNGEKAWYCMSYSKQLVPFMDWVAVTYFPSEAGCRVPEPRV